MKLNWCTIILGASLAFFAGVGCSSENAHDDDGGHGHFHAAPHGGSLVMLGNHVAQLELVADSKEGDWNIYVLNGGAERFVRIEQTEIRVRLEGNEVVFAAVANPDTGETVGDTAQFSGRASGLTAESSFSVEIDEIEVFRQSFTTIEFNYPEGKH